MTGIVLPSNVVLIVVNLYCWTNGHLSEKASQRSEDLMKIVVNELSSQPEGPRIILGDLNANPEDIPTLQNLLDLGHY
eukprot:8713665-Karenia_brevis.AAC.1